MAEYKQCEFFVLRYTPQQDRDEFVNVGVVLLEAAPNGFTGVRFTRDWRRARCLDPDVDVELLTSYEHDLSSLLRSELPETINYRGPMARREWLLDILQFTASNVLEISPVKAVLTESPSIEIGRLAQIYLDKAARSTRPQTGRRVIYNGMRDAFEAAGVWALMRKDIPVAQYTRAGDPLKIDCGYRPNGTIHLFHALSLSTSVDSAKVLAFSYSDMREGLMNAEHTLSDLTVIVEDELDEHNEEVAFALATLQESEIAVARLAQMPQIAERARLELKL
jgi:hypothetical protein